MKRGGPIQRRKPLNPGTKGLAPGGPLPRYTPLTGGAGPARSGPLPAKRATPRRRDRDEHRCCGEAEGKAAVRERSGGTREVYGPCEICGERRACEWSHRIAEGRGGCWCPSNGIAACSPCHRDGDLSIHRAPGLADKNGWTVPTWTAGEKTDPASVSVLLAGWAPRRVFLLADGGIELAV